MTYKCNSHICSFLFGALAGISGALAAMILYSGMEGNGLLLLCILLIMTSSLIALFYYLRRPKPQPGQAYKIPYFAENKDIIRCLESLNGHPLKLVVSDLFVRPGMEEKPWVQSEWGFEVKNGTLVKSAFVTEKDVFQFSVADARSRQDWHFHNSVFEIFLSAHPIRIEYMDSILPDIQTIEVQDGMLMVPPGLKHKVTLHGITYVFQATLAEGGGINQDKTVVET